MTQFRSQKHGNIWTVEYSRDGENEWHDLSEDPSEIVCDKIAAMLNEANLDFEEVCDRTLDESVKPESPVIRIHSYRESPSIFGAMYGNQRKKPNLIDWVFYRLPHIKMQAEEDGNTWHQLPSGWIHEKWFRHD